MLDGVDERVGVLERVPVTERVAVPPGEGVADGEVHVATLAVEPAGHDAGHPHAMGTAAFEGQ